MRSCVIEKHIFFAYISAVLNRQDILFKSEFFLDSCFISSLTYEGCLLQ